ncbi:MAG: hypothetical protein WBP81_23170 [Solirubrobacteraceae bacterium]
MPEPADLGVLEASALLRARKLSALELAESCLRRIEERNGAASCLARHGRLRVRWQV